MVATRQPISPQAAAWYQERWAIVRERLNEVLGRPRLTEDIDVLVILERRKWTPFLGAGQEFGFAPRIDDGGASRVSYARAGPGGIGPVGG